MTNGVVEYLCGVPDGYDAFVLQTLAKKHGVVCHIAQNDAKCAFLWDVLHLVAPKLKVLVFPAWDTVPYDRVAPKPDIVGGRIDTLTEVLHLPKEPVVILTTPAAVMQRVPAPAFFEGATLTVREGDTLPFDALKMFLVKNGYRQTDTVMEAGEYAVRGGIIDLFPAGAENPVRLDFFGDEVDTLKSFDPLTQRTKTAINGFTLKPMAEFDLNAETISRFRTEYRQLFHAGAGDAVYEAVSDGRYVQGLEHYLPLFHERMSTFLDYIPNAVVSTDFHFETAVAARDNQIKDYYDARMQALTDKTVPEATPYRPIPPESFFLSAEDLKAQLNERRRLALSPFIEPSQTDMKGRSGRNFVEARVQEMTDVFETVADFIHAEKRKVIISGATFGSAKRLSGLLREKGVSLYEADTFQDALKHAPAFLVAPFEKGFSDDKMIVITETDILGNRIIRPATQRKNAHFIEDISTLNPDDLIVHQTHGVGRFTGLVSLNIGGAVHDCLCLIYDGGDKLFVPVENGDVLSKYGSQTVGLDKLGSTSFASRKEKVKKDLLAMADKLIGIASVRALNKTERILAPHGMYQEFCARFPYTETEDQLRTIQEIEADLAAGKPMDRLVCGDVGFGKTEVALRAAFLAAMAGLQVAVVVPTTLLARQHALNFMERFKGFPIRVNTLSRLVSSADAKKIHKELETGILDIVIGTHAVLSKNVKFKNLGLVIVDEEQHFGVTHKERLKELKKGVHVLTLTATPIPRTLQLSLSGVRELSIIATPPVDRLAVKTFVTPFDPVIVKEAILHEHFRGGQTFVVCPRISDIAEVALILRKLVPDIRIVEAHGQMAAGQLEKIMTGFADKKYDVLLATSIVESGLDIPSVNTIVVYRADMFGLSALYQLRGRVGRGKRRAYAYLTTPPHQQLTVTAEKRLSVMQSLDSLGAGFALASHDLDIRGAGNLLGDEQSGHIKEVGIALYQKMLADAIHALRAKAEGKTVVETDYSPQLSIGLPVLIPETYIADLDVRMNLYHRMSAIEDAAEIESLKAELVDRFGVYPVEVENLLTTIDLKILAKQAHIERLDAGPKGANIAFYQNTFPNPAGLIEYISTQMGTIKIRPDQKVIVTRPWEDMQNRLTGIRKIIAKFAEIAAG